MNPIKHIAGDIDNDEVIMSSYVRYVLNGDVESAVDSDGKLVYFLEVREL